MQVEAPLETHGLKKGNGNLLMKTSLFYDAHISNQFKCKFKFYMKFISCKTLIY